MRKRARNMLRAAFFGMAFAWLLIYANTAKSEILIRDDPGGRIVQYIDTFVRARQSGQMVVIDGNCLSACTLVLGLVPKERICATEKARLGFHAAWTPDEVGRPITSKLGTEALQQIYPKHVLRWIAKHGGLSEKMIFLQGAELARMVQQCQSVPQGALSAQASRPRIMINRPFPQAHGLY